MEHTKEPWQVTQDRMNETFAIENEEYVCAFFSYLDEETHNAIELEHGEANAKRIVECVNALAGIENPSELLGKLREAFERALSIKSLWMYSGDVGEEHAGEARALCSMAECLEEALKLIPHGDGIHTTDESGCNRCGFPVCRCG